eukprot:TRINITY_DN7791_c0_g3_i1.p1 TRINITY_DN7791_c0_g3~~TRINITY_DN7791_c0_g3_i1.p1  ORF type:complete len:122 (-),score=9.12 TRINITY_DN7791_c0_g3_i1:441-806(-)
MKDGWRCLNGTLMHWKVCLGKNEVVVVVLVVMTDVMDVVAVLNVGGTKISDEVLRKASQSMGKLKSLKLDMCAGITGRGLDGFREHCVLENVRERGKGEGRGGADHKEGDRVRKERDWEMV